MVKLTSQVSAKLINMSFLCAILVVFIHVQRSPDSSAFITKWIACGLSKIAVPYFFIAAGFLALNHVEGKSWWLNLWRRKVDTLLIPFFCLNLFYFPIKYGIHYLGCSYFGASGSNSLMELSIINFLGRICPIPLPFPPVLGVLWFVRALMVLFLLMPLFVWIIRRSRLSSFLFLAVTMFVWLFQPFPTLGYEFSVGNLFWFALGSHIRQWGIVTGNVRGVVGLLAGCFCLVLISSENCFALRFLLNVAGISSLIFGIWTLMPAKRIPDFLGKNSFAVFVFHEMIIYCGWSVLKVLKVWDASKTPFWIVVSVFVSVSGACILGCLLRRHQLTCRLFLGGR